MNIAILHSGDLESISLGGIDRYIKSLIQFCDDSEITVFGVTRAGKHKIGETYTKTYQSKTYFFVPIIDDSQYPLSIRYAREEFKWTKKLGTYDIIYAQRVEYSIPFLFSPYKTRLIQMIHGSSKYSELFWGRKKALIHRTIERMAIRTAEKTYIIQKRKEFGVPYYKERYRKYSDRISYGKNPINLNQYYPRNKDEMRAKLGISAEKVILFSGRIEHNPKRVLLFPDIMQKTLEKYPCSMFVVIGDGADLETLKRKARDSGLKEHFLFTGYIEDPESIAEYNSAADVTINISIFEGTCTSNLEAIACGVPVVSTDVGDIHEYVPDGRNGIIIPNDGDENVIESAVNALEEILSSDFPMDCSYRQYSGDKVVREIKEDMCAVIAGRTHH